MKMTFNLHGIGEHLIFPETGFIPYGRIIKKKRKLKRWNENLLNARITYLRNDTIEYQSSRSQDTSNNV